MSVSPPISWTELFTTKGDADLTLSLRVLKKSGEPFLILPDAPKLALEALAMYPAQTGLARAARWALGVALRVRVPVGLERTLVSVSREDPFVKFLRGLIPGTNGGLPPLAILAGNARVEGRRFILLLFDEHGHSAVVVKAGIGDAARRLIQKEKSFLQSVSARSAGFPEVRSAFESARIEALALAYVAGDSPSVADWRDAGSLLAGWIDPARRVRAEELAAWKILATQYGSDPLFAKISAKLAGAEFCATLAHGDFAPWNIKVTDGAWTALDWERGEPAGFPGWDWFHYVIQGGILVEKLTAETLLEKLGELFRDAGFQAYAAKAGIAGREQVLAAAYMFYCVKVLRPTEGGTTAEQLLALMNDRWLK